jgi:hypothetical protein
MSGWIQATTQQNTITVCIQVIASFIQAWNDFGDLKAAGRQEKRCIWLHCKASVGANIFLANIFFYLFITFFF